MSWLQQADRFLSIKSPLGEGVLILTQLSCTEAISEEFSLHLTLMSQELAITPQQLVGKPVTIRLKDNEIDTPRYFHGIINQLEAGPVHEGIRTYSAEAIPWLGLLDYASDCRIFQHKTVVQIAQQLFQEFGFYDYEINRLQKNYPTLDYCVQYHESTLNFLKRILAEAGIYYFFQHSADKHQLILVDRIATLPFCSQAPIPYSNTAHKREHYIKRWTRGYQLYPGKAEHRSYDFEKPYLTLQGRQARPAKLAASQKYETYHYLGRDGVVQNHQDLTQQLFDAQEASHDVTLAESNVSELSCGHRFTLSHAPLASDDGDYIITHVKHFAADTSYKQGSGTSQVYRNSFDCIPAATNYKPYPRQPKPVIQGPQTAVVVGPEGEEIYTDAYGRVKVHFHWVRNGTKDDKSSCWVRVAQQWASQGFGTFFIPRVGDEVIVQFLDGDPDRPLIVGSVYNAERMPPYELPQNQTQSGIKTHSSKGARLKASNELRFEDKKDKEEVYIHAQKDFNRVVENSETAVIIKGDHLMKVEAGRSVLEASKAIVFKVGGTEVMITEQGVLFNSPYFFVDKS